MTEVQSSTRIVARRIKEARQRRGWSAQRLAEEVTAVGVRWDRSIVANLESGRRAAVSIEEFLALAYVLDVAPVDLLVPGHSTDQAYRVVPEVAAPSDAVREWIRGESPLPGPVTAAQLARFVEWMPNERSKAVMRAWLAPDER